MKRRKMLSILLCAALLFSTAPAVPALAVGDEVMDGAADAGTQAGDLSVRGGTQDKDFTYDEEKHVLTIKGGADLTISGETTADRVVVAEDATAKVTLDGVSIIHPNESGKVNYDDKTDANAGIGALTLNDGASLTLTLSGENTLQSGHGRAGIFVPAGASLTIDGEGSLDVTGGDKAAGIGGDLWHNAGAITIESGTITATGGTDSAGIGGAHANDMKDENGVVMRPYGGFKSITIEGGNVTATASGNAAGIGTGCWAKNGGTITITDATVSASTTGRTGACAAIGHGYNGEQNLTTPCSIAINDSLVSVSNVHGEAVATGGGNSLTLNCLVIEGSVQTVYGTYTLNRDYSLTEKEQTLIISKGSTLTIGEQVTLSNTGAIINDGDVVGAGKIQNNGTMIGNFEVSIEGNAALAHLTYLDENGEEKICEDYYLMTNRDSSDGKDRCVVFGDVTINSRLFFSGDSHLILADNSSLTVSGGLDLSAGDNLTIYAQSTGDDMGRLTVQNMTEGNAGIGIKTRGQGDFYSCGTTTINGGYIDVSGGNLAAGIGGGVDNMYGSSKCEAIVINGGHVMARGGANGAGIGCGTFGDCGMITVNGGTVHAIGGREANAIGRGYCGGDPARSTASFSTGEDGHAVIYAMGAGEIIVGMNEDTSDWNAVIFVPA